MLSLQYLEENREEAIEALEQRKNFDARVEIELLLKVNKARKNGQKISDTLAERLRKNSKKIGYYLANGEKEKAEEVKEEVGTLKKSYKKALQDLKAYEEEVRRLLLNMPNIPHKLTPKGENEKDNKVIYEWGDLKEKPIPHWELLETYDLVSFSQGTKITGSGFPIYKKQGAKLQRALINFFLDQALAKGYQEIIPPLLVNAQAAESTGQLPDKEGLMYSLQDPPFYLIPTAEVPVTNLYSQTLLEDKELPIKHVAYTPCFRKEAGSWGADVRGLNRLHQFDKVELVEIHPVKNSEAALQEMRIYVQSLLEKLGLPYRTLLLSTNDLGHSAAITYDLEVWSGGQKRWLEVSSISLFNDYQARRMQLRYQEKNKKIFCHTLNGSALALPRILAALLENYQKKDQIEIPPILHPYTGFSHISSP